MHSDRGLPKFNVVDATDINSCKHFGVFHKEHHCRDTSEGGIYLFSAYQTDESPNVA